MLTAIRPDDTLLATARSRRLFADTALNATGGGDLLALDADPSDAEVWHAEVRTFSGDRVAVRLDGALGTVVLRSAAAAAAAATARRAA